MRDGGDHKSRYSLTSPSWRQTHELIKRTEIAVLFVIEYSITKEVGLISYFHHSDWWLHHVCQRTRKWTSRPVIQVFSEVSALQDCRSVGSRASPWSRKRKYVTCNCGGRKEISVFHQYPSCCHKIDTLPKLAYSCMLFILELKNK